MTLVQYQLVARGCPVVDCTAESTIRILANTLLGLGDRLVHLVVSGSGRRANLGAVRDGATKCVRLRKMQWMEGGGQSNPVMGALLSTGCNGVHSLKLHREQNRQRMDVVARNLTTLREFRYCEGAYLPHIFTGLARSSPHLRTVDIDIKYLFFEMDHEAICVETVKSFAACRSLCELYVDICGSRMVSKRLVVVNALDEYRRRSASVALCDVKYLP